MYPKIIQVKPGEMENLTATFQSAYKSIVDEISTATNFGVANRKAILAQIEAHLKELGANVDETLKEKLTEYYKDGASEAVMQLKNVGAKIPVASGFNRIHVDAIQALISDTSKSFGDSIVGVGRSADLLLGRATRSMLTQKMAKGIIGGDALKQTKNEIKGILAEQGLSAIKDKSGRAWTLDSYAEMLYRTKVVEARNRGLINRTAENGYDLVQVSDHASSCELCAPWQGEILSLSGDTTEYDGQEISSLAEAEAAGLFHPNCRHAINILVPSLAKETQAYDRTTGEYT